MNSWLNTGLIGTIITAICCFTPVLVWLFAAIGLAGAIAYLDIVLLPLLAVFVILTIAGFIKSRR